MLGTNEIHSSVTLVCAATSTRADGVTLSPIYNESNNKEIKYLIWYKYNHVSPNSFKHFNALQQTQCKA